MNSDSFSGNVCKSLFWFCFLGFDQPLRLLVSDLQRKVMELMRMVGMTLKVFLLLL